MKRIILFTSKYLQSSSSLCCSSEQVMLGLLSFSISKNSITSGTIFGRSGVTPCWNRQIVDIIICQNVSHKVMPIFYLCGDQLRTQSNMVQIQHTLSQKLGMLMTIIIVNSSVSVYSRLNVWQIRHHQNHRNYRQTRKKNSVNKTFIRVRESH